MKKQLLIAAVAATMTSAAMADISISGAGEVHWKNTDTSGADSVNTISHDIDLKFTGKSGDTSVVMDIETKTVGTAAMNVKNAYMATSIAGANVKIGTWYGSDSLLGNGGQTTNQMSVDYSTNGVKVQYEFAAAGDESVTISGSVAGVAVSHEMHQDGDTDTKVSGSFGGVNVAYRTFEQDIETATATDKTSTEISTDVNGITLTYANINVDGTGVTSSDAFFGEQADLNEATGFGLSTSVAGNSVSLKSFDIKETSTAADDSYTKLVVSRALTSGAALEVAYTDKDTAGTGADVQTLDVELKVSF